MSSILQEQDFSGSEKVDTGLWLKVVKLLGPQKKYFFRMFIFMILMAGIDVIVPLLNKYAIDNFIGNTNIARNDIVTYAICYFFVLIFQSFNVYFFLRETGKVEMGFCYEVRKEAFHKLQSLSFSYYDKTSVGWLMARITSDVGKLAEIISWSITDMVWGITVMFGVSAVMLTINWKLSLFVLIAIPLLFMVSLYFQKRILKSYRIVRKTNSRITSSYNEGINGAKTTKTLVLEDYQLDDFQDLTSLMSKQGRRAGLLSALFMPIVMSLGVLSTAGILYYGGNEVLAKSIEFGTLALFIQYSQQFFEPMRNLAGIIAEMQMAQASAERIVSLLETEPEIVDTPEVVEKYGDTFNPKFENYEDLMGDIEFENVGFYYNKNEVILKNFNLKVKKGETIALVGETGSGKTTVVNLLCRFYEAKSGRILIDGVDVKDRSVGWLHHNLGYVLQAPHLFSGSIEDNIRFGRRDATHDEVVAAAKVVNIHDFIMGLEKGYDTDVNEGGGRLSTGEKQLISFARAVIANPKLVVLDEATSSIDTEKEKEIQDAIVNLLQGRTSFIVAHRLSTITGADRILVMQKGVIVESGTHDELMALGGYYRRLYTNQFNEGIQDKLLGRVLKEED